MASVPVWLAAGIRLIGPSVLDLVIMGNHPIEVAGRLYLWEEVTNKGHYDKTGCLPSGGAHQNSIKLISRDWINAVHSAQLISNGQEKETESDGEFIVTGDCWMQPWEIHRDSPVSVAVTVCLVIVQTSSCDSVRAGNPKRKADGAERGEPGLRICHG